MGATSRRPANGGPDGRARLDSDKAQRIIAAMHASVARRGAAGSTFDQVAQEAGVSRGLLHYYFGSKERLIAEVVRHDAEVRLAKLGDNLAKADSVYAIVDVLVEALEDLVERDPASYSLTFELFTASRHNDELREEMAELYRQVRAHVASILEAKQEEGVVRMRASAEAVTSVLFALGDGMALQLLSDPAWDSSPTFAAGADTARHLLGGA